MYDKAIKELEATLSIEFDYKKAYPLLAESYRLQGMNKPAISIWEKYLKLNLSEAEKQQANDSLKKFQQ